MLQDGHDCALGCLRLQNTACLVSTLAELHPQTMEMLYRGSLATMTNCMPLIYRVHDSSGP